MEFEELHRGEGGLTPEEWQRNDAASNAASAEKAKLDKAIADGDTAGVLSFIKETVGLADLKVMPMAVITRAGRIVIFKTEDGSLKNIPGYLSFLREGDENNLEAELAFGIARTLLRAKLFPGEKQHKDQAVFFNEATGRSIIKPLSELEAQKTNVDAAVQQIKEAEQEALAAAPKPAKKAPEKDRSEFEITNEEEAELDPDYKDSMVYREEDGVAQGPLEEPWKGEDATEDDWQESEGVEETAETVTEKPAEKVEERKVEVEELDTRGDIDIDKEHSKPKGPLELPDGPLQGARGAEIFNGRVYYQGFSLPEEVKNLVKAPHSEPKRRAFEEVQAIKTMMRVWSGQTKFDHEFDQPIMDAKQGETIRYKPAELYVPSYNTDTFNFFFGVLTLGMVQRGDIALDILYSDIDKDFFGGRFRHRNPETFYEDSRHEARNAIDNMHLATKIVNNPGDYSAKDRATARSVLKYHGMSGKVLKIDSRYLNTEAFGYWPELMRTVLMNVKDLTGTARVRLAEALNYREYNTLNAGDQKHLVDVGHEVIDELHYGLDFDYEGDKQVKILLPDQVVQPFKVALSNGSEAGTADTKDLTKEGIKLAISSLAGPELVRSIPNIWRNLLKPFFNDVRLELYREPVNRSHRRAGGGLAIDLKAMARIDQRQRYLNRIESHRRMEGF